MPLYENYTIFHPVVGYFKRTVALIRPAPSMRGLYAGKLPHGIMSCFGLRDAYCKLFGNNNIYNQTKAIFTALSHVRSAEEFALARGRKLWELNRSWISRPARFTEFDMPENLRMKREADEHDARFRHVRSILKNYGRDQMDTINTPHGLYNVIKEIEDERLGAGISVPWRKDAGLGPETENSIDDFVRDNPDLGESGEVNKLFENEDFDEEEFIYFDKDLVDPDQVKPFSVSDAKK